MELVGNHPLIVQYYKTFKDEYNIYILMESINGVEFFELLNMLNGRTFNPITVAFYASNIILILEYLHNLNIIYRDLKLENIMIDDEVNS